MRLALTLMLIGLLTGREIAEISSAHPCDWILWLIWGTVRQSGCTEIWGASARRQDGSKDILKWHILNALD